MANDDTQHGKDFDENHGTVKANKTSNKMTICEMHRRIYKQIHDSPAYTPEVDYYLNLAFQTGKKITKRLRQQKMNWDDSKYHEMLLEDKTKLSQDEVIPWEEINK